MREQPDRQPRRDVPAWRGILTQAIGAGLLFALAWAVRALTWTRIFTDRGIFLGGNDPYYHLRRVEYAAADFPSMLGFDPYLNYPVGSEAIWTPTLDFLLTVLTVVIVGPGDREAMEALLVHVPPVIGAATVVAVALLGARHFGRGVAFAAAAFLAILPAHSFYSTLGAIDHHVAVAAASLALLFTAMSLAEASERSRPLLAPATRLGVAIAVAIWLWPGCAMFVVVVQLGLGVRWLTTRDLDVARRWGRASAASQGIAAALVVPLAAWGAPSVGPWGAMSPIVASSFQPLWLFTAGLCFAAASAIARPPIAGRAHRAWIAGLLLAGASGLLLTAVPELRRGLADAMTWFSRSEDFQALVHESVPLLSVQDGSRTRDAERYLSRLFFVAPLAWALLAASPAARRAGFQFFLLWWVALAGAALAQFRFVNSFAATHALLIAAAGAHVAERLRARSPAVRRAAAALALAMLAWALAPPFLYQRTLLREFIRVRDGAPRAVYGDTRHYAALARVADWLRENTPPTAGWLDTRQQPEYGILAGWGDGHLLRYVARRPLVQDNFGDDVGSEGWALAEAYFALEDEDAAAELLEQARVRFVVVRASGAGHGSPPAAKAMLTRLFYLGGSERRRPQEPAKPAAIPALKRHRIVYESAQRGKLGAPLFRVFERVAGARVEGVAEPGTLIEVTLPLRDPRGKVHRYKASAFADSGGAYALVLPYSTDPDAPQLPVIAAYELRGGGVAAMLPVPEQAVLSGLTIAGPELRRRAKEDRRGDPE